MSKSVRRWFALVLASTIFLCAATARADTLIFAASTDANLQLDYNWLTANNWYTADANGKLLHVGRLPNPDETAIVQSKCVAVGSVQIANLIVDWSGGHGDIEGGSFIVDNLTMNGRSDATAGYAIIGATTMLVRHQMVTVGDQNSLIGTTLTIGPGAAARIDTDAGKLSAGGGLKLQDGTLIINQGAFVLPDHGVLFGEAGSVGCRFNNLPGATLSSSGAATVQRLSGGFIFDNSGNVRADGGTLLFDTEIGWTSTSGTGTFQATTADAVLTIKGLTVGPGTTYGFSGPGTTFLRGILHASGNLNIGVQDATSGVFVPGNVKVDAQIDGAGTWHVVMPATAPVTPPSTLTLTGDNASGKHATFSSEFKSTVNIDAPARLILDGDMVKTLNGTFNNAGLTTWTGPGGLDSDGGVVFNNLAGGVFEVQNDAGFASSFGLPATFNNAGTFRKSAGVGRTGVGPNFNNTGTVDLQTGTTYFNNYTQTAGILGLNGGNLDSSNAPLNLHGGVLNGVGTITGSVTNGGTISPGHSPGVLNLTRDYTQSATGSLNIEIGGRTPGTQFDQLNIGGIATLAGALNVQLVNGFHPLVTDHFAILKYGSNSGTFATVSNPLSATYNSTNLTLALNPNAPLITSFTPAAGVVGSTVTITGSKLAAATVFFGKAQAAVNTALSTATHLVVTVPAGAISGPVRVTTAAGTALSAANFTVVFNVSGTITKGTLPLPGVSSAVPNVPVFLVNRTNLPALAAVVANPTLLASSSSLIARTSTNAAGQYLFKVQPGAYVVVAGQPGVFFTPVYHMATVTTASAANQNFVGGGVDTTAPTVVIGNASATSVSGSASDGGSGVLTVVATLQNSGGQYLNWSGTSSTPQFTTAALVGSYRLVSAPGSTAPLLNLGKVAAQNWSLLLPAVLPAGTYRLTVRAIDRALRVSAPVVRLLTKSSSASLGLSNVRLSTATASSVINSVQLSFNSLLDGEGAANAAHYSLTVNGREVAVESAAYNASARTVTLALPVGSLHRGDSVQVSWSDLLDTRGQTTAGTTGIVTAR